MSTPQPTREEQVAKDKVEYENTVRVQRAQNGFIVKTTQGPFIFHSWPDAAKWLSDYFASLAHRLATNKLTTNKAADEN